MIILFMLYNSGDELYLDISQCIYIKYSCGMFLLTFTTQLFNHIELMIHFDSLDTIYMMLLYAIILGILLKKTTKH